MALGSPATDVIMTAVELVMAAAGVVMSTLSPLAPFCSMPNNSTKAPRVPEPSSAGVHRDGSVGGCAAAARCAGRVARCGRIAGRCARATRKRHCQRPAQSRRSSEHRQPLQPPRQTRRYRRCFLCRRSFQTRGSASQNHRPQGPFNSRKATHKGMSPSVHSTMAPLRKRTEQHP